MQMHNYSDITEVASNVTKTFCVDQKCVRRMKGQQSNYIIFTVYCWCYVVCWNRCFSLGFPTVSISWSPDCDDACPVDGCVFPTTSKCCKCGKSALQQLVWQNLPTKDVDINYLWFTCLCPYRERSIEQIIPQCWGQLLHRAYFPPRERKQEMTIMWTFMHTAKVRRLDDWYSSIYAFLIGHVTWCLHKYLPVFCLMAMKQWQKMFISTVISVKGRTLERGSIVFWHKAVFIPGKWQVSHTTPQEWPYHLCIARRWSITHFSEWQGYHCNASLSSLCISMCCNLYGWILVYRSQPSLVVSSLMSDAGQSCPFKYHTNGYKYF